MLSMAALGLQWQSQAIVTEPLIADTAYTFAIWAFTGKVAVTIALEDGVVTSNQESLSGLWAGWRRGRDVSELAFYVHTYQGPAKGACRF